MWIRLKQCVRTIVASVRANQRVVAPMPIKEPPRQESEAQLLERARRLEEMRLAEVQKLVDERRREEARLRSELLYDRHARQLAASFPRERFEQFVERYMSEATAPELVDQREQWLKEMMMDSLGTVTIPKFASLSDLATFFSDRRRDIDKLPHAEDLKDIYHKQLNKQEDEALRRLLKP